MRKKLEAVLVVETLITAIIIGIITYFVIYGWLANGHLLTAYILNIAFIAIILVLDKAADHLMTKDEFLTEGRSRLRNIFARILFVTHLVSFKTALYLFYIVMLIVSRISILEPELIDIYHRGFINTVEYGIVLLIPLDKFVELMTKDDKRILKMIKRIDRKK